MKIFGFLTLMLLVSCGGSSGGGAGSKAQDPIRGECRDFSLSSSENLCVEKSNWIVEAKSFEFPRMFAISFEEENENGEKIMVRYIDTCENTTSRNSRNRSGTSTARFKSYLIKNVMRRIEVSSLGSNCDEESTLFYGYPSSTSLRGSSQTGYTQKIVLD